MIIEQSSGVGGAWLDKKELKTGDVAKLTTEATWVEGTNGQQLVAKVRIKGQQEDKNLAINTPTRNALIQAFGKDSKEWINHHLTVYVENGIFAGKRGIMLNLVPEGFEVGEDDGGYIVIKRKVDERISEEDRDLDPKDIPF